MGNGERDGGLAGLREQLTVWPKPGVGRSPEWGTGPGSPIGEGAQRPPVPPPAVRAQRSAVEALLTGPWRQAFETIPMGAAVLALGGGGQRWVLLANPALAEMLGVDVGDLSGRDLAEFSHPDGADEDVRAVGSLLSGEATTYTREKWYRRTDRHPVSVELRGTVIDVPGVPGVITVATFVDVTERQRQERHRALSLAVQAAVTSLVTRVLGGAGDEEIHRLVVDQVARLFDVEHVSLMVVDGETERVELVAGTGLANDLVMSGQVPLDQELALRLMDEGIRIATEPLVDWARKIIGPVALVRFGPAGGGGLLSVGRAPGRRPFTEDDGQLLLTMGQQVALALELGRARADEERLVLLEERERIARDLHDVVIQDLIAIGIQLGTNSWLPTDAARRERDDVLIEQLEEAVRRLRGSVFELREPLPEVGFGDAVRATAARAARVLGHRPTVNIAGYFDAVSSLAHHAVLAVLREALSNVARHAHANATSVFLDVTDRWVRLVVEDDGLGLPDGFTPGDGLANIQQRAASLGGSTSITARRSGGTRLVWTCPLPTG